MAGGKATAVFSNEAFSYETGGGQWFLPPWETGWPLPSTTGYQLLNDKGTVIARQVFSMKNAGGGRSEALAVFTTWAAQHCMWGIRTGSTGKWTRENPSARYRKRERLSGRHHGQEAGYRGMVRVITAICQPLFEWYYRLRLRDAGARIARRGKHGGSLRKLFRQRPALFLLSSEERGKLSGPGRARAGFDYMSERQSCRRHGRKAPDARTTGAGTRRLRLRGYTLADYRLSGGFTTLMLSKYRSGNEGRLLTSTVPAGCLVLWKCSAAC